MCSRRASPRSAISDCTTAQSRRSRRMSGRPVLRLLQVEDPDACRGRHLHAPRQTDAGTSSETTVRQGSRLPALPDCDAFRTQTHIRSVRSHAQQQTRASVIMRTPRHHRVHDQHACPCVTSPLCSRCTLNGLQLAHGHCAGHVKEQITLQIGRPPLRFRAICTVDTVPLNNLSRSKISPPTEKH